MDWKIVVVEPEDKVIVFVSERVKADRINLFGRRRDDLVVICNETLILVLKGPK